MERKEVKAVVAKREIIKKITRDPEWRKKLDAANTDEEILKVLEDFSNAKGYRFSFRKV